MSTLAWTLTKTVQVIYHWRKVNQISTLLMYQTRSYCRLRLDHHWRLNLLRLICRSLKNGDSIRMSSFSQPSPFGVSTAAAVYSWSSLALSLGKRKKSRKRLKILENDEIMKVDQLENQSQTPSQSVSLRYHLHQGSIQTSLNRSS